MSSSIKRAGEVIPQIFRHFESVKKKDRKFAIPTGYSFIDQYMYGGFQRPDLVCIESEKPEYSYDFIYSLIRNCTYSDIPILYLGEHNYSDFVSDLLYRSIGLDKPDPSTQYHTTFEKRMQLNYLKARLKNALLTYFDISNTTINLPGLINSAHQKKTFDIIFIESDILLKRKNILKQLKQIALDFNVPVVVHRSLKIKVNINHGSISVNSEMKKYFNKIIFLHRLFDHGYKYDADGNQQEDFAHLYILKDTFMGPGKLKIEYIIRYENHSFYDSMPVFYHF